MSMSVALHWEYRGEPGCVVPARRVSCKICVVAGSKPVPAIPMAAGVTAPSYPLGGIAEEGAPPWPSAPTPAARPSS
eukprot:10955613-Alexandrium_andersonii.AAC.1